jgi:hypothetical protein
VRHPRSAEDRLRVDRRLLLVDRRRVDRHPRLADRRLLLVDHRLVDRRPHLEDHPPVVRRVLTRSEEPWSLVGLVKTQRSQQTFRPMGEPRRRSARRLPRQALLLLRPHSVQADMADHLRVDRLRVAASVDRLRAEDSVDRLKVDRPRVDSVDRPKVVSLRVDTVDLRPATISRVVECSSISNPAE